MSDWSQLTAGVAQASEDEFARNVTLRVVTLGTLGSGTLTRAAASADHTIKAWDDGLRTITSGPDGKPVEEVIFRVRAASLPAGVRPRPGSTIIDAGVERTIIENPSAEAAGSILVCRTGAVPQPKT